MAIAHVFDTQLAAHSAQGQRRMRAVSVVAGFASAAFILPCVVACGSEAAPNDNTVTSKQVWHSDQARGSQGAQAMSTRTLPTDAAVGVAPDSFTRGAAAGYTGTKAKVIRDPDRSSAADVAQAMVRTKENERPAELLDDAGVGESSAAGGVGAGGDGSGGTTGRGAAGASGASGAAGFGAGLPFCVHPPECVPVITSTVGLQTCCPNNGESCGYSVLYPQELDDGTCRPNSAIFLKLPGQDAQRVETEGAPDQLITPECQTRSLLAFTLPGCCMPNNRCGISTYHVAESLLLLSGVPAAFTRVQCTSVETLNLEFRVTPLAGLGQIPPSDGRCDYQALDAKLPHKTP